MVKLSLIQKSLRPDKIMAIDASTNNIAFALFDKEDLKLCGKINFTGINTYQKVVDAAAKCKAFFNAIDEVDAIVIEHTVFMNSPKTAADLALVQGAVLGAAGVKSIRSVAPITWQNFIGNKKLSKEEKHELRKSTPGKSDSWYKSQEREIRKARTIRFADIQYDRILTDNDIADAIGIGHYAVNNWEGLTK